MIEPDPRDRQPQIHATAWVAPNATVIGSVSIGHRASVWFGCVLRGDEEPIDIGARTNVQDGVVMHTTLGRRGLTVADDVVIGHGAVLHGCSVGPNSLIGIGARILDDSVVEEDAFVAAGALVAPRTVVRRGEMWGGVPARRIRPLRDDDREMQRWAISTYVERSDQYRSMLRRAELT